MYYSREPAFGPLAGHSSKRFRIFPPSAANLGAALVHPPPLSVSPCGATAQDVAGPQRHRGGTFSLLRSALPTHEGASPYPRQAAELRERGYVVDLHAGEALYLPARWLHEVASSSAEGDDGHMAVNFCG